MGILTTSFAKFKLFNFSFLSILENIFLKYQNWL